MSTSSRLSSQNWRVQVSRNWDTLGPFPIHAREQHFISPSFPLNLSDPLDFNATWPSSYADDGYVAWSTATSNHHGNLEVSFPRIRWQTLRATEGWAALQYHAVLRTVLTLYPPSCASPGTANLPRLLVNLLQGSYFALLPFHEGTKSLHAIPIIPQWYSGNIYAMERALPQSVALPIPPSLTQPTRYELFISGDYEIRLFGDPRAHGSEVPTLSINLDVQVELPVESVEHVPSHDVVCDFVGGLAFGRAIGIGLRSTSGWWTVTDASVVDLNVLQLNIPRTIRIAPSQTRIVPIYITQAARFYAESLSVNLTVVSGAVSMVITTVLAVKHHSLWSASNYPHIKASYIFAGTSPTSFLVLPPMEPNIGEAQPPVLALHGAGVDVVGQPFWAQALPRQNRSWIVIPSGRTSWGLDWHGPSALEAWSTLDALADILTRNKIWAPWRLLAHTPIPAVVIGHSNGGQGAWYLASRFPDRVLAVVPAAAYIKSQAYVPLLQSRFAHFMDPALRSIMETSLTPDDNDLFLSNLVDTPVLAVHGDADDNVPIWHSREAVNILKSWYHNANVTYKEDPGQPHWYPSVFDNNQVRDFLEAALTSAIRTTKPRVIDEFTLTVAIPHESGPLRGWRIEALRIPGRLARLRVTGKNGVARVRATNVQKFSVDTRVAGLSEVIIDGDRYTVDKHAQDAILRMDFHHNSWVIGSDSRGTLQPSGRLHNILTSEGPLTIVVPDPDPCTSFVSNVHELSIALRIAHDLDTYHKLDSAILTSAEARTRLANGSIGRGNLVIVGDTRVAFVRDILCQEKTAFRMDGGSLKLRDRLLDEPCLGVLFLHPHPTDPEGVMLFLSGNGAEGLERARRLFPIRSGITLPDWLLIGEKADQMGAAGVSGAGVWGQEWTWNDMSWHASD